MNAYFDLFNLFENCFGSIQKVLLTLFTLFQTMA